MQRFIDVVVAAVNWYGTTQTCSCPNVSCSDLHVDCYALCSFVRGFYFSFWVHSSSVSLIWMLLRQQRHWLLLDHCFTLLHKRFLHIHLILSHWNLLHEVISFKKWRRFVWLRDSCARAHFKMSKSESESEIGRAIKTNMLEMIYIVHASNLLSNKNIFEKVTSFPP